MAPPPFDAEAAKFNFDRYRTDPRSNVKADLNSMASAEVTGKYQVTLHLTRPNVGLPAMLTNRIGLMVSPIAVKLPSVPTRKAWTICVPLSVVYK